MASKNIITVTLNTAVDYILQVDNFQPGRVYQSGSAVISPAGKGINVARTVASLEYDVTALGFIGQKSSGIFDSVSDEFITTDFIQVPGMTRINVTLLDAESNTTTHIRNPGYHVRTGDVTHLFRQINNYVKTGDLVVLSGSLPGGVEQDIYQMLIQKIHSKDGVVFLDTSGSALRNGIQASPDIIKPNLDELSELSEGDVDTRENLIHAMTKLSNLGIDSVLVSMGEHGLLAYYREVDKFYQTSIPDISSENKGTEVGCGDALVGGYAVGIQHNMPVEDTLRYAVTCGTANLLTEEPGRIDKKFIDKHHQTVKIKTL